MMMMKINTMERSANKRESFESFFAYNTVFELTFGAIEAHRS